MKTAGAGRLPIARRRPAPLSSSLVYREVLVAFKRREMGPGVYLCPKRVGAKLFVPVISGLGASCGRYATSRWKRPWLRAYVVGETPTHRANATLNVLDEL